VRLVQRGEPRCVAGILCLHVFTLSENPGRGWFLRSFPGIGTARDRVK